MMKMALLKVCKNYNLAHSCVTLQKIIQEFLVKEEKAKWPHLCKARSKGLQILFLTLLFIKRGMNYYSPFSQRF